MKGFQAISIALLLGTAAAADAPPPTTRERAEEAARLAPRAFPGLPPAIAGDLESRGCSIPQSYVDRKPPNAIRGEFHRPGERDWAVLCSRNGESAILVYPRSSPSDVQEVARRKEDLKRESLPDGTTRFGFDRQISAAEERYIVDRYRTQRLSSNPRTERASRAASMAGGGRRGILLRYFEEADARQAQPIGSPATGGDCCSASQGAPKLPPIDHQGINDAWVEKASIVHYWHRGRWIELPGAD